MVTLCTKVEISAAEDIGGMKKKPVFESKLVTFRIEASRSSSSDAWIMLRSLIRTAANLVLKPERSNEFRMALISFLSCSSELLSCAEMLKKQMNSEGTCRWCFVNHSGVITPSGKIGEPRDRGDNGECNSVLRGGLFCWFCSPSVDVGCGMGAAFRGGNV